MGSHTDESKGLMDRRSFLKWTITGLGGIALSGLLPNPFRKLTEAEAKTLKAYAEGKWIPSCCNMCGGQCGILAYVENGVVKKIEPHGTNPNNIANVSKFFTQAQAKGDIGRLCCKGNSGIRSLYDPDRIKTPLKRIGPRGSGQFEPISWSEAIELCAQQLTAIRNKYGARSLVWFSEDHSFTHIQQDFCDAFGTPNYSNHSNLCDVVRKAHFKQTVGHDRPLADMEDADLLVVFGWNFLSALKWIHLAPIFARGATKPGFKFIYIDPVFNVTASKAHQWIAPRPGTDGALALAVCKLLIDSGKYDKQFVKDWTFGFGEFKKYLDGDGTYDTVKKDAKWAEEITGVPSAVIENLAGEIGDALLAGKKICIDVWSGPGHHTNGTQGGRAINALMLLVGGVDKEGTMLIPTKSGPSRRSSKDFGWPMKDGWRFDGRDDVTIQGQTYMRKYLFSHSSGIYVEAMRCMAEQKDFLGNDYPIKAAVIVFQNILMSTPNVEKNKAALEQMEFIMVVDTHLSETAMWADIVIPGSNYLERYDFNSHWVTFRAVGLRQPVVKSWIGGLSETQFFLDLGAAMGFPGFKTDVGKNDTEEAYLKEEWERFIMTGNNGGPWANQMSWEDLKKTGIWVEDLSKPTGGTIYEKHKKKKSFDSSKHDIISYKSGEETIYVVREKDATGKYSPVGIATGETMKDGEEFYTGFGTVTRRAQFWSPELEDVYNGKVKPGGEDHKDDPKYHPLPYYVEPIDSPNPAKGFPLYFISWKEVVHTHTRSQNNPILMQIQGENKLFIHPDVAKQLGISEDDWVWVETPVNRIRVKAHVTKRIQKDTVGFFRGYGHWALGKVAKGRGAHDGWLLPGRAEHLSGQAVHKEVGCRVYKAL